MSDVKNTQVDFGGPYMVQDRDHMSEIVQSPAKAKQAGVRQADQAQSASPQQGSSDQSAGKQQQGERRRQAH